MSETTGEPSCKRQENGDASTGSDRPLKKARFAWQVKGNRKHRMKNESSDSNTASSASDPEKPNSSQNESISHDLVGSTEQNLEILGDYLLKQDFNTLDSVITDTDKSLLKPCTSISTEKLEYPRYVSSYESNSNRTGQMTMNMSMVASQSYNEDQCIARWQARQMAKGFVDNTINRVLDSWLADPLPSAVNQLFDIDNRFLALDVAEFINNMPGDNSIENEGILMAISAHGLQNTPSSSSNESHNVYTNKDSFPSRSSSPSQEEETETNNNKKDNSESDLDDMSWPTEANGSETGFSLYPDVTNSSYPSYIDDVQIQNSNADIEDSGTDYTSHFDFMDAAVSFAIQNKGLTSFGSDYG